ncbi:MAG TPA: CHRD domain-containing protein [Thermoleophilaceae bacterium]|jgi:hypothetical protein
MLRRSIPLVAALVAALAVTLPATAAKKKPAKEHTRLAALSGQEEAPGPGDPDGYGAAQIRIKGKNVCFVLLARQVAPVTAAHIHKAPVGQPGDVVVALYGSTAASSKLPPRASGCVKTTAAQATDIVRHPGDYYVNVHNADFPNGALRGQLTK